MKKVIITAILAALLIPAIAFAAEKKIVIGVTPFPAKDIASVAKEVFEQIFAKDVDPDQYVEEHGLKTVNDEGALEAVLEKVIADNPQAVADYRGGKEKALGALVGQTMKAMKGKANPGMVNQMLRDMLK